MGDVRGPDERALVRAAAEDVLSRPPASASSARAYRTMARGTLAALDWVEGRSTVTPSTDVVAGPHDFVTPRYSRELVEALDNEIRVTEGWGSGHERVPREDLHFHGAVWALLRWWERPGDDRMQLSIDVPGLVGA